MVSLYVVTISGPREKPRASPSIAKFGHHFVDCVRQTRDYCRTKRKSGESTEECAQGICWAHLRHGSCAIGGHLEKDFNPKKRSGPPPRLLKRLEKRKEK